MRAVKIMESDLPSFMSNVRELTDAELSRTLSPASSSANTQQSRIYEAMSYSVLNGGKRVRPILCFAAAALSETDIMAKSETDIMANPGLLTAACSLELIHAYSLVHDDLPAMDDDDLRRGKPTTHIAFDEATAILAGDALQTKAFDILIQTPDLPTDAKLSCLSELAFATGADGMTGGQMIDLEAVGKSIELDHLETMHKLKTGALIRASILLGAYAMNCDKSSTLDALKDYAEAIGLAFQVKDDILDATVETNLLGKQQGADLERNKPTYVSHLGLDGAIQKLNELHSKAFDSLSSFNDSAIYLRSVADYIVSRTH